MLSTAHLPSPSPPFALTCDGNAFGEQPGDVHSRSKHGKRRNHEETTTPECLLIEPRRGHKIQWEIAFENELMCKHC